MSNQYHLSHPRLSHSDILTLNTKNPSKAVEYINSYIDKTKCEEVSVDISFMNVIDACYVSTMCSTKHFIKHPDGKINWYVSSGLVKEFSDRLSLGNSNFCRL